MPAAERRWTAREVLALIEESPLASPFDVELEPETITQPDIFVISPDEGRRMRREGLPSFALLLTVEVLSPSSSRHDRVRKRPLYQRHVPEYWIGDLDARLIERWRTGEDRPEIIERTLEWLPEGATQSFVLDVERFFAEVMNEQG